MTSAQIDKFVQARRRALLSMDESRIRRFMRKWNPDAEPPEDPQVFWASVHKARTAATDLPEADRFNSHQWLKNRRLTSYYEPEPSEA